MPALEQIVPSEEKPCFSISQLAKEYGVTTRTIRFYEDKQLLSPDRSGSQRKYSHRDAARLALILRGKRLGFSLSEVEEYLNFYDSKLSDQHQSQIRYLLERVQARKQTLLEQRAALEETWQELRKIEQECHANLK